VISIADDSKAMNDYASTMQERAEELKQKAVNNQENTSRMYRQHHRVAEVSNRGEYQCQTCQ